MYILCMCIYIYYVCIYYVTYIIYIVCEGGREGGRGMYTKYRSMHIVHVDRNAWVYRLELSLSLSLALSRLKRLDSLSLSSEKTWLSLLSCHLNTLGSGPLGGTYQPSNEPWNIYIHMSYRQNQHRPSREPMSQQLSVIFLGGCHALRGGVQAWGGGHPLRGGGKDSADLEKPKVFSLPPTCVYVYICIYIYE